VASYAPLRGPQVAPSPLPPRVEAFRASYRADEIGPRYTAVGHFALTSVVSLLVIGGALSRLSRVQPLEWRVVPGTFLARDHDGSGS
jgi:hypothetical protein